MFYYKLTNPIIMNYRKMSQQLVLFLFSIFILTSCNNDDNTIVSVCEEDYVNDLIMNAYASVNDYDLMESMDLETHEYKIQINADGEICSIGYQNPSTYVGDYTMEVINGGASYSGTHSFSQAALDYQSITTIPVSSGDIITIRRTIVAGYSNLDETIGSIYRRADYTNIAYPIPEGSVVFLESNFYGAGGPIPNFGQPYIPFGFKEN